MTQIRPGQVQNPGDPSKVFLGDGSFGAVPGSSAAMGSDAVPNRYDMSTLNAATRSSTYFSSITTYVGGTNSVVEPSVVYDPDGWGSDGAGKAWRFWMVFGPYESRSAANENPSIMVSDTGGDDWVVPTGLTNPVISGRSGDGNNCDPQLFWDAAGTLYLSYTVQNSASSDGVYYVTSTDGVTWSAAAEVLSSSDPNDRNSTRFAHHDGKWWCWYVDATAVTIPFHIKLRTATTLAGLNTATATTVTGLSPLGTDTTVWEFEVKRVDGEWWMLGTSRYGDTNLFFATSVDGLAWTQSAAILTGAGGTAWDYQVYKSAFVPFFDGSKVVLWIWYNGWNNGTESHVAFIKVDNAPLGGSLTVEDEGTALTDRSTMDFQGAGVTAADDAVNGKTVVTIPGAGVTAQSYTPTWTGGVTNPTLGNGTLIGRYVLLDKIAIVLINLTFGSTTTLGSGSYAFSLPAGITPDNTTSTGLELWPVTAYLRDASSGVTSRAVGRVQPSTLKLQNFDGATSSGTLWSSLGAAIPWTWASGDSLSITAVLLTT